MAKIHQSIRRRRIACGLTQQELGDRLGLHKTTISHWENGIASPRASMLAELAGVLGIGVADFYPTKKAA